MTVDAAVTETRNGTELLAECRRCLALGVPMSAEYIKRTIDLIEDAAITDLRAWVQATNNATDGRSTAEAAVIA
jgi:hypothetical protein